MSCGYYGDPLEMVSAVFIRSEGEFMRPDFYQNEGGTRLVDLLISKQMPGMNPAEVPGEMRDSALTEIGNIILSSFLNAINVLIGGAHSISVPGLAHDMLGSILDVVASIYGQFGEYALIVDTSLKIGDVEGGVSGKVIMLPDPGSPRFFSEAQVLNHEQDTSCRDG